MRQILEQQRISDFNKVLVTPDPDWQFPPKVRPDYPANYETSEAKWDRTQDKKDFQAALLILTSACLVTALGFWKLGSLIAGLIV